MEQSVYILYR